MMEYWNSGMMKESISGISLETFLQLFQPPPHGAVIDIAADLDTHSANQRRILRKGSAQPRPVLAGQVSLKCRLQFGGQWLRAFDFGGVSNMVQLHQAAKIRQYSQVTARFCGGELLHDIASEVF